MTSVKIVLDSSADLTAMEGGPFALAPSASVTISTLRGLCSYYAERGGMLVGCEV